MSKEKGDAPAKLLFLLVLCAIVGAVASPWLLRASRTAEETAAITTLKRIHAAQTEHYGASRLYASIERLRTANRVPAKFRGDAFAIEGYKFTHTTAGSWQRWCAQAIPDSAEPTGSIYGVDESGIVKEFPAGTAPCHAGELTTPGTPVR